MYTKPKVEFSSDFLACSPSGGTTFLHTSVPKELATEVSLSSALSHTRALGSILSLGKRAIENEV